MRQQRKYLRQLMLRSFDTLIVITSVLFVYVNRFDFRIPKQYSKFIPLVVIIYAVLIQMTFQLAKIYKRVWQYFSIGEIVSIIKAATATVFIFYLINVIYSLGNHSFFVPRSVIIYPWFLIITGVGGSRLAWRIFRDSYMKIKPYHKRTMIVGAGHAGVMLAKELTHSSISELYPVAFIDDDPTKCGMEVVGLPVIGGRNQITEAIEKYEIEKIVIAMPSASKTDISEIFDICKKTMTMIKILPRVSDLVNSKVSINMVREVNIEDLLGREQVHVDLEGIAKYINDKVVLVTGAGGSIGSELCRQVSSFSPRKLLLLGHGENSIYHIDLELIKILPEIDIVPLIADVQDLRRLREIFDVFRPNVVFHAAAHKHVPLMEFNPGEAVKNNIIGTKNVADCAHEFGATHFVMISTDKAVNPTNVMGTTKRVAEMYIQGLGLRSQTKFTTVRFGNVLGSRGSVVPLFKQQIQEGGPVTVTHPEIIRFFMTIPEAAQLVIQAGAMARKSEIYILDMGDPVKIADLARDLIRLSGFEPDKDIKIVYAGLRPGEKLYEEILTDEEGLTATVHNRIYVGSPIEFSWDELSFGIKKLEQLVQRIDYVKDEDVRIVLKQLVPTYQYNLSVIEEKSTVIKELAATDNE